MRTESRLNSVLAGLAVLALLVAAGCGSASAQTESIKTRSAGAASVTTVPTARLPQVEGMTIIDDSRGNNVGYVPTDEVLPKSIEAVNQLNARTMIPVTDAAGTRVGYYAFVVGFIPLATADAPGFDVEKVIADSQGGCEPPIGNPNFKEEFPTCPQTPVDGGG